MLRIKVPTQYSPLRNSLFFLTPVSLKCYTSPPSYPLAGGESLSPAPPNCQGVETYDISDYIPVRNIPKTKGADTVIPLGNDFQSPPQKVSSIGEAGKGGGGVVDIKWNSPDLTLVARDFSSAVSGFCRGFAARSLWPKTCRPSADTEDSRRTREKPLVPRVP